MFCKNCGAQIADNATFCPKCGAQVGNVNTASTQARVNAGPSIFQTMGSWIKSFFSSNVVSVLKDVATDQSLTGLVGLLFEAFLIASFITMLPIKLTSSALGLAGNVASSYMGGYGGGFNLSSLVNVPGLFFQNVFTQFIFIVLVMALLLGILRIVIAVTHKTASVKAIMNVMFYSLLPLGFVFGACFIFTIISAVFGLIVLLLLSSVATMMTYVLLYNGFQKLDKFDKSPFYAYMLFGILFFAIAFIIFVIDLGTVGNTLISQLSALENLF